RSVRAQRRRRGAAEHRSPRSPPRRRARARHDRADPRGGRPQACENCGGSQRARSRAPGTARRRRRMTEVVRDAVVVCVVYLVVVYGIGLVLAVLAFFVNHSRVREGDAENWRTITESRFTIPVSVIAPMHNEEVIAVKAVEALLALDYPELEVIIVNDGSTDGTLVELERAFDLQPFDRFERRVLPTR